MLVNWFVYQNGLVWSANLAYHAKIRHKTKVYSLFYNGNGLHNHCYNNDLLGTKRQRTVTGFLHTSAILPRSAILNFLVITWAVYDSTCQCMANWPTFSKTRNNKLGPSYDFLKVCKVFVLIFMKYIHSVFWPLYFHRMVNPYTSF